MHFVRGSRKRLVDVAQVFFRQGYVKASGILLHMGDAACLGPHCRIFPSCCSPANARTVSENF